MSAHLLELARRHGPLAAGGGRVVVLEPDGRVVNRGFSSRAEAETSAREATRETEDARGSPIAGFFSSLDEPRSEDAETLCTASRTRGLRS